MQINVLCLHGMGVNAEVFAAQTGQYRISRSEREEPDSLTDNALQPDIVLSYHHITSSISSMRSISAILHPTHLTIMLVHIDAGIPHPQPKTSPPHTKLFLASLRPVGRIR